MSDQLTITKKGGVRIGALFIKAWESKQPSDVVAIVLIIIGVWIFKEVREGLIEVDKQNSDRIDKALLIYGELEAQLLRYRNDNTTDFAQIMASSYPYFEKKLIKKAYILKENPNLENIDSFLNHLKDEIIRLKSLQIDPVSVRPSGYFIGEIIGFLNKTKFDSFIQPILFVVFAFMLLGLLSAFVIAFENTDIYGIISLISLLITYFFDFLIFANLVDALFNKRFNHSLKNWLAIGCLVIFPAFLSWKTYLYYHWLSVVDLVLCWVYLVSFWRDSIQREED